MSEQISIEAFARKYSVDTETVRSWVKKGRIPYELSGRRQLVRKTDKVTEPFIKPIQPDEEDPVV